MGKLSYPSTVGYLRNGRCNAYTAETTASVATVMAPARRSWIGRCTSLSTGYYGESSGSFGQTRARQRLRRVNVLGMTSHGSVSRRSFLAAAAAAPLALAAPAGKSVPIGIELYSVKDEMDDWKSVV